jgi:phenylalanyl-tRNA synthetase beta chain
MKVSLSWLNDYVPVEMGIDQLADALTMLGLEVEEIFDRYDYLETVKVGRVESVEPHPNADHLKICQVSLEDRTLSIICGAPNVRPDALVPVALPDTLLPDGSRIATNTIRGIKSEGMIGSELELGLGTDGSGVMILDEALTPGESLNSARGLSDLVLDIDLTPNRPDCLSILGIAREVAALQGTPLNYPRIDIQNSGDDITRHTSVTIDAPELCPRYTARLLEGITVGDSPFWMQDRLMSVGLRPINNIVDITNFVMLETGQPLHAFDFDQLAQHRIVVRTAAEGEKFVTLDEKERSLNGSTVMICDGEKPVGIGGVMGGLNSEIEPATRRVLLESACFNPVSIRKTAKKLSLNTDASHRFERGVDPDGTLTALNRAILLMAEIAGGKIIEGVIDAHPRPTIRPTIGLSVEATNRLLGTQLAAGTVAELLRSIEFEVTSADDNLLEVVPPSYRVDVSRPEDLMEEVARLSGYNNIPTTFPRIPAENRTPSEQWDFRNNIRGQLTGLGFFEGINYTFISDKNADRLQLDPEDDRRRVLRILNPLTEDQSVMRTSLLPGLLTSMWNNISQQNRHLKIFEIGNIFISNGQDALPREIECLSALWTGNRHTENWLQKNDPCDFYDIKGLAEELLDTLGLDDVQFSQADAKVSPYLKPGVAAQIGVGETILGNVGELHANVLKAYDLDQPAFILELDFEKIRASIPTDLKVKPIPKFPATTRDVTIIVNQTIEAATLLRTVTDAREPLVENLHLFDVFQGDPIPTGKKSVSFRITYRSHSETLEDRAINEIHKHLTTALLDRFDASLPG